jgi:hypothetical protein
MGLENIAKQLKASLPAEHGHRVGAKLMQI